MLQVRRLVDVVSKTGEEAHRRIESAAPCLAEMQRKAGGAEAEAEFARQRKEEAVRALPVVVGCNGESGAAALAHEDIDLAASEGGQVGVKGVVSENGE